MPIDQRDVVLEKWARRVRARRRWSVVVLGSPVLLFVMIQVFVVFWEPGTVAGTALGVAWATWTTFAVIGGLVLRASAASCFCGKMPVDDDDEAALKSTGEGPRSPFCETCGRLQHA